MNRPTGVTVIGWLAIIGGAFAALAALVSLLSGAALLALGGAGGSGAAAMGGFLVLMLALWLGVLGAADIVFGLGALRLRGWAWTLGVVIMALGALSNFIQLIAVRGGAFGDLLSLAINLFILYYLFTADVKTAFGKLAVGPTMAPLSGQKSYSEAAAYAPPAPTYAPPAPPVAPAPPAPTVESVAPDAPAAEMTEENPSA